LKFSSDVLDVKLGGKKLKSKPVLYSTIQFQEK